MVGCRGEGHILGVAAWEGYEQDDIERPSYHERGRSLGDTCTTSTIHIVRFHERGGSEGSCQGGK
jgi:hypothetical protein